MNIGQLNFLYRQKIQKQLILPHTPSYIIHDSNGKSNVNHDIWYFTSENYVTLKKKKQNTKLTRFLKEQIKQNNSQSQVIVTGQGNNIQKYKNENFLVLITKQSNNYLNSKIKHILTDHANNKKLTQKGCQICQKIEKYDNYCVLAKIDQVKQFILKQNESNYSLKIDQFLKKHKKLSSPQQNTNILSSSPFNIFFNSIQSYKYTLTRIQQRISQNFKLHKRRSFQKKQQQYSKIVNKISSIYWHEDFVLFGKDGKEENKEKITNHMKLKLIQKCQVIREWIKKQFEKIICQYQNNNSENDQQNQSKFKININSFKLWYFNNDGYNNHLYTIMISNITVNFINPTNNQNFNVQFYKNINLLNQNQKKSSILQQQNKNILNIKNEQKNILNCQINIKLITNKIKVNKLKSYSKRLLKKEQVTKIQDNQQITYQKQQDLQNNCNCCGISFNQTIFNTFDNIINVFKQKNMFPSSWTTHLIIKRHISKLKSYSKNYFIQLRFILQQLLYEQNQINKNKTIIDKLLELLMIISNTIDSLKLNIQTLQQSRNNSKRSFIYKLQSIQDQYQNVSICSFCYKVFIQKINSVNKLIPKPKNRILKQRTEYTQNSYQNQQRLTKNIMNISKNTRRHISTRASQKRSYSITQSHHQNKFYTNHLQKQKRIDTTIDTQQFKIRPFSSIRQGKYIPKDQIYRMESLKSRVKTQKDIDQNKEASILPIKTQTHKQTKKRTRLQMFEQQNLRQKSNRYKQQLKVNNYFQI